MRTPMNVSCAQARDWIDDAIAGHLARGKRDALFSHLDACVACRTLHEDARIVREHLTRSPRPACPDEVVDRIHDAVRGLRAPAPEPRWWDWLRQPRWRPALAALGALALVVLALTWFQSGEPGSKGGRKGPTAPAATSAGPEEVERAVRETRLAFAIMARAMNRTATVVEGEVRRGVARGVMAGMEEGFHRIAPPRDASKPSPDGAAVDVERPAPCPGGRGRA